MTEEKKSLIFNPGNPETDKTDKDVLGVIYTKDSAKQMIRHLEDAIERYADSDEFYVSQNGTFRRG